MGTPERLACGWTAQFRVSGIDRLLLRGERGGCAVSYERGERRGRKEVEESK